VCVCEGVTFNTLVWPRYWVCNTRWYSQMSRRQRDAAFLKTQIFFLNADKQWTISYWYPGPPFLFTLLLYDAGDVPSRRMRTNYYESCIRKDVRWSAHRWFLRYPLIIRLEDWVKQQPHSEQPVAYRNLKPMSPEYNCDVLALC